MGSKTNAKKRTWNLMKRMEWSSWKTIIWSDILSWLLKRLLWVLQWWESWARKKGSPSTDTCLLNCQSPSLPRREWHDFLSVICLHLISIYSRVTNRLLVFFETQKTLFSLLLSFLVKTLSLLCINEFSIIVCNDCLHENWARTWCSEGITDGVHVIFWSKVSFVVVLSGLS